MSPVDTQNPSLGQFGHLVIGEEAAAAEAEVVKKSEDVFGPLVRDHHPSGKGLNVVSDAVQEGDAPPVVAMSVKDLEAELEATPAYAPRFFRAEMERVDGPRKGALEALLKAAGEGSPFAAQVQAALDERYPPQE